MEERDFSIISSEAAPDQVDAIIHRRAAGHVGTVCVTGDVRNVSTISMAMCVLTDP